MHKNNVFIFVIGFFILTLLFVGCGSEPQADVAENETAAEESEPVVIGLSLSTLDNPFFESIQEGAADSAERLGAELIVQDAANDADTQEAQIRELIGQGVSAILVNPVDGDAIVTAIEAANAAGIPVLTVDRSAAGGEVESHIASDNQAGGEMAGEYLAEVINEAGEIIELEGIPGTSATQERGAGFNAAIAEYESVSLLAQEVANFSRDEGKTVFEQLLADHEIITAVFAHNDEMILGAIDAAKEANRAEDIVFVGFDAIDDAIIALEDGDLTATIAQQPVEMGRLSVETAVSLLNGESVESFIPVELALITR